MKKLMISVVTCCAVCLLGFGAAEHDPEKREAGAGEEKEVSLRQVEVTLLGPTSALKGIEWPDDPDNVWRSRGVAEPCELTVHLPGGRTLTMRTRPILIVSRIMPTDIVGGINAPPEGKRGSLRQKADEAAELLAHWGIEPDERMRKGLEEWRKRDYPGTGIGALMRVWMYVDDVAYLAFRVHSGGPEKGGWHLVVEIDAKAEEMQRVREEKGR